MPDSDNVYDQMTDEQMAEQVQRGRKEFFAYLMRRYYDKILRYGHKFFGGKGDVEDAVQEIFIKSYKNIKSFDTGRKFSSWLYRIAHNEFINALKKKSREPFPFFDADTLFPHPIAQEDPHNDVEMKEMREFLEKGLDSLSVKYREVLILYYLQERSYKEIADIIRIPISTVGVRVKRGKEALKNNMKLV